MTHCDATATATPPPEASSSAPPPPPPADVDAAPPALVVNGHSPPSPLEPAVHISPASPPSTPQDSLPLHSGIPPPDDADKQHLLRDHAGILRNQSGASLAHDLSPPAGSGFSSASSMSRASSARSTNSVQAVPFRTPNRTPARTPALSRTPSNIEAASSSLFRSVSGIGALASLGEVSARVPEPLTETSGEDAATPPSVAIAPINSLILNPGDASRGSFLAAVPGDFTSRINDGQLPHIETTLVSPRMSISKSADGTESTPSRVDLVRPRTGSASNLTATKTPQDFKFGEILGEGSYSTVYLATDKVLPDRSYAVKVLDKRHIAKEKKVKYVAVERDTLNKLDRHPGCLRLYWTFQDPTSLYYVLEYASKGEILKAIKQYGSFDETCARFYTAQILSALEHMHSRGVIHRDLKPENILLDADMRVKMADFGSAKIFEQKEDDEEEDEYAHSFVGTAEYVSPELLIDKVSCKSSDFWALGCVLYQFIAGHPPFKSRSEYLTFQKITSLDYIMPDGFSNEARDLVQKLLVIDPKQRLGAAKPLGIEAIKNHPFFSTIEWSTLWAVTPPVLKTGMVEPVRSPVTTSLGMTNVVANMTSEDEDLDASGTSSNERPQSDTTTPVDTRQKMNGVPKQKSWLSSRRASQNLDAPITSPNGMTWVDLFLPNELMIYSSPIIERKPLFSKKRTLIVTNYPRLLCVKEDKSVVRIKHEILFRPSRNSVGEESLMFRKVIMESDKSFLVQTSKSRSVRFEDPSGEADRWTAEITFAHKNSGALT